MRVAIFILLVLTLGCASSDEMPQPETNQNTATDFSEQKLLLEGDFQSNAHPTSGKARIYEDKDGKKTLVFENFKTDPGPDLRIYLSNDKVISSFVEVSMKVENGNRQYSIPNSFDSKNQKFVLIWCKQFAVLFGHSELK